MDLCFNNFIKVRVINNMSDSDALKKIQPSTQPNKAIDIISKQGSPLRKLRLEKKETMSEGETGINQVNEAKQKLDNLIEDLNDKLVHHFRMKEQALLNQYKEELVQQQKQLNELKNNTNQEQIKAKMLQRKAQLEKQRNHLIQTNMFFSKKCEQYKQNYSQLVQEAQDLQRQIKFLDQQIDAANAKRVSMIEETQKFTQERDRNQLPLFSDKKIKKSNELTERKVQSTTERLQQSNSMRKIAKSLHVANFAKNSGAKSGTQLKNKSINHQVFQKGVLQKLFEESVQEVKNRRKSKRTMPNLKGEEFTEYEKRAIMQIFLSNEEVKKKIYEIIFENNEKTGKGSKADPMIKISFEEIGM